MSMHGFEYSPQSGGSSLTGGKARTLRRSIPLTSYSSNKKAPERVPFCLEQMTGIEPAWSAWEAEVLPLNYICKRVIIIAHLSIFVNSKKGKNIGKAI